MPPSKPPPEPPSETFGECHVSPNPPPRANPGSLRVRRAARACHVSRVPKPGEFLRMPPEHATCPECPSRETLPGTFRVRRVSREPTPGDHPGHSASTPRVPGSVSFFRRILEKYQKMSQILQNHRNSSFSQKNPKPIFKVSF